jgi:hypothetical protein
MPVYIVSPTNTIVNTGSTCKDTVKFFGTLATKLLDMAEAIQTKIENIKKQVCAPSRGFLLAEIEAPRMILGVRLEYLEYIKRFGPPDNGIFNEERLDALRKELGIDQNAGTI